MLHSGQRIGKGWQLLDVPSGLLDRQVVFPSMHVSQQSDYREQTQQGWRNAQDRQVGPLSLGLHAEVGPGFMESDFDLPTSWEPSTTLVSAMVNDAGGINRVVARVLGYGEVEMTNVGGNVYQATLGTFSDTGEFSILIQAWDNAGNNASAGPLTVTVVCIG